MTKSNLKQATYKCFKLQSPKEAKHSIKPEHRNAFLCENTSWAGNFEFLVVWTIMQVLYHSSKYFYSAVE